MNYDKYIRHFQKETVYHTPKRKKLGIFNRIISYFHIFFYIQFIGIVFRGSRLAKSGNYNYQAWIRSSLDVLNLIEKNRGRFSITGLENLRKNTDKPVILVGNHMSALETVILPAIIQPNRNITFIVKESLVKQRVFGAVMRSRDPVVVGRQNPKEDLINVMTNGKERLKNGISIVIFPQSTRHVHFDPKKFNSIGIKLAQKAGVNIVPFALKTDFWANGKLIKDFGKIDPKKTIHITFGTPMQIEGNGKPQHQEVINFIQNNLDNWN